MRFDELWLYSAVHKVREDMKENGEKPGAKEWEQERSLELTKRIRTAATTEADKELIDVWVRYRKAVSADEDDCKKYDIIIALYDTYGPTCFYAGRGLGDCSDDVTLDRIVPDIRGGEYTRANCVLACSYHNSSRNDKSLEDLLRTTSQSG